MDPFEVRMQFLGLLRKLNATQQSIQKVVSYALKYFSKCGEDLWECIIEECQKGSINHRINILYFLDSLCETSLLAKAYQPPHPIESSSHANNAFYVDYVARDLSQIVECVVPVGRQGLPNLTSTKQILQNWRTKRVIDPQKVDDVMQILFMRQTQATEASTPGPAPPPNKSSEPHLSRGEIFKRIEEDRERHKRLRERRWVQTQAQSLPSSTVSGHAVAYNPYGLASFLPLSDTENAEVALDIEFENEWEATSDWNEDDVEAIMDERELCYPHLRKKGADGTDIDDGGGEEPMDLS